MITKQDLEEIRELVQKTVLNHLASNQEKADGSQVVIHVGIDYIPPPASVQVTVGKGTMAKMHERKAKLFILHRPVSQEEWQKLESLQWPVNLRRLLDHFQKNGNKATKFKELERLGVLERDSTTSRIEMFNQFLRSNKIAIGLRPAERGVFLTDRPYRIYPLSANKDLG